MSRLWDTPGFWARSEADDIVREYPDVDVARLAESFEGSHASYDGDPVFARNILEELRKRADAGVRFWPEPEALPTIERDVRKVLIAAASALGIDDDTPRTDYWWERM